MSPTTHTTSARRAALALAAGLLVSGASAADDFVVVVHPEVRQHRVERDTLRRVFLGKKKKWDDGTKVTLAVLEDGDVQQAFMRQVLRKSPRQFSTYWKRMLFSGKGALPRSFESVDALLAFVRRTPGAVCVVPAETQLDGLVALAVDR